MDIRFITADVGWTIGFDTAIFYTTTGGDLWVPQHVDNILARLEGVFPLSENACWIVGGDTLLLKTTNAGNDWERKAFVGVEFDTMWSALGVYFTDTLNGWVSGYYRFSSPDSSFVLRTNDGGETWNKQYLPQCWLERALDAIGPLTAWLCCDEYLFGTTDGTSWSIKYTIPPNVEFYDVDFVNALTGWMVRLVYPAGTEVARSDDGGNTWFPQLEFGLSGGYTRISFIDSLRGWVASSDLGSLKILFTQDGGKSWNEQFSGNSYLLGNPMSVFFSDSVHGWVVTDEGKILHTANGGITSIDIEWGSASRGRIILYPNPFSSSTTLRYYLEAGSDVQLVVYDLLGREVFKYIAAHTSPGEHALEIDFNRVSENLKRKLPSGVYYGYIVLDKASVSLPMLFLR